MEVDFSKSFDFENNFYLSCDSSRISKILIHYELFKMSLDVPGDIVECGVFKGASFANFASFRQIFGAEEKKLVGFDTFDKFPNTEFEQDKVHRDYFIERAGDVSISSENLIKIFDKKGIDNVDLVRGDIIDTVPEYVANHSDFAISFLNLDTDICEPAQVILEYLYPKISIGGVLVLDDYNVFPGETYSVDEYFSGSGVEIKRFDFRDSPYYIIKS